MEGEGEHQIMKMQIEQRENKMWKGGRKQSSGKKWKENLWKGCDPTRNKNRNWSVAFYFSS